jgi:hypothetical protein
LGLVTLDFRRLQVQSVADCLPRRKRIAPFEEFCPIAPRAPTEVISVFVLAVFAASYQSIFRFPNRIHPSFRIRARRRIAVPFLKTADKHLLQLRMQHLKRRRSRHRAVGNPLRTCREMTRSNSRFQRRRFIATEINSRKRVRTFHQQLKN